MRHLLVPLALLTALAAHADTVQLRDNAPDRHVVVKGDTLWDISGKFLRDPWRWPEVWQLNRDSIKNPHRIYPGDVVVLDRSGGQPRLSVQAGGDLPSVRLSPGARATALEDEAIPAIPIRAIHAFLAQPRVVEAGTLDASPYVLGTNAERVVLGAGDEVFATGGPAGVMRWNVVRPGKALKDPETGDTLGFEVEYLGDARTVAPGAPQRLRLTRSVQEIVPRDKIVAADDSLPFEFVPRAPGRPIEARIVSAYAAVADTGRYQTVVLNRGARDGLEPGHVLAIFREGRAVKLGKDEIERMTWVDRNAGGTGNGAWLYSDARSDRAVKLPDARSGLVMVYRVFDRVAYALIMQSDGAVHLLDRVRNP